MKKLLNLALLMLFSASALHSQGTTLVSVCFDDTLYFNSELEYYTIYEWDFGDGNSSYLENPEHKYSQAGTYEVSVTAYDLCCPDDDTSAYYTVIVDSSVNCNINTFTLDVTPSPVDETMYVTYYCSNPMIPSLMLIVIGINSGIPVFQFNLDSSNSTFIVDVSELSVGFYCINLIANNFVEAQETVYVK